MKEPKFETRPLEKKPENPPEIETWEGEGGPVEAEEETPIEVPETVVEEEQVKLGWREILLQTREEHPDKIKIIIDKISKKERIDPKEQSIIDRFANRWFTETFGIRLKTKLSQQEVERRIKQIQQGKQLGVKKVSATKKDKKPPIEEELAEQKQVKPAELAEHKRNKMERLHLALRALDAGEPVEEFRDETRRIIHFDEDGRQYFVEENMARRNIGIGDIVSDYAWGIKYVPDGEMIEPAYRTVAKRILVNEARRDLEEIHNSELITQKAHRNSAISFSRLWPQLREAVKIAYRTVVEEKLKHITGWAAEVSVRELLSRISLNENLDFVVFRSTVEEDADFTYDFRVRMKRRIRGVDVQSKNLNSIGFQLKTKLKKTHVNLGKKIRSSDAKVDEIITLNVPGRAFRNAIRKWLIEGEPSGGPEQFLSPELKKAILKAVTEKLVDIPQDVFDKIQ